VALLIVAPPAPRIAERRGDRRTVMAGMHLAVAVAAAFAVLGFVLAAWLIPRQAEVETGHRRPAGGV